LVARINFAAAQEIVHSMLVRPTTGTFIRARMWIPPVAACATAQGVAD